MTETIALITGANKGIGYEVARQLGAAGVTVLLGARSPERGQSAAAALREQGAKVRWVPLDVTDQATIDAAEKWIDETYGQLDVLVNNAGIAREWGHEPAEVPIAQLRETYETNVFGVVAVTNALLPLLRRAPAARIVNVSSYLGSLTGAGETAEAPVIMGYNTSKTALNAVTVMFAKLLRDTPIKVNAGCPGYCATDLNGHSGPRTAAQGATVAVRLATLPGDGPSGRFLDESGPLPW